MAPAVQNACVRIYREATGASAEEAGRMDDGDGTRARPLRGRRVRLTPDHGPNRRRLQQDPEGRPGQGARRPGDPTKILTYHVVPERLAPAELAGTHKTLEGGEVTVAGSGTNFAVNGNSAVVCGNVQTSNAPV